MAAKDERVQSTEADETAVVPAGEAHAVVPADVRTGQIVSRKDEARGVALRLAGEGEFASIADAMIRGEEGIAEEPDPDDAWNLIYAQIFSATTPEDVLTSLDATGLRQLEGKPLMLKKVDFQRSAFDEGSPYYAVLYCTDIARDEELLVTCGGKRVMAQVIQLARLGALPIEIVCQVATKATKAGYYPLRIEKP